MKKEMVMVISFDDEKGRNLSRVIRNRGVYSEVIPWTKPVKEVIARRPDGVIFAVADGKDTMVAHGVKEKLKKAGIPFIVGIPDSPDNFLYNELKLSGDWNMDTFIEEYISQIREKLKGKRALCALSGGVDSSVCAALIAKACKEDLVCIFVDNGLLRKNESEEVYDLFKNKLNMSVIKVDAKNRFLEKLDGVTDPERKRKIIGEEFIRVFEDEASKLGKIDFLVQGTIYPDIIESGTEGSKIVKSHHNVGGLPDAIDFEEIIEPLKYLFKDEVRKAGLALGLPENVVNRQPFPGPGLAVRVIGAITEEKLDILRDADHIFREEIARAGLAAEINQYFAVLTNMRSVGVKDLQRTYDYTVALRAVNTRDFMAAKFVEIPYGVLRKVSERIVNEVEGVNRIVYDITDKPPATIEWE